MKYIMCQPAIPRFKWELEVCVTRLKKLGITDIVLLFSRHDESIPRYFETMGCEVHVYNDERKDSDKRYIPSIKPYLWVRYLEEDISREFGDYFYMDCDVLLREIPEVLPHSNKWYGSNCSSYLGVDYIDSKGDDLLYRMCNIVNIDAQIIRRKNPRAGAQWVLRNPSLAYWRKVYQDSVDMYVFLSAIEKGYVSRHPEGYVPIQKWTAEMWAQLWNLYYFDKEAEIHEELNFCWATDDIARYKETKIMHNAGVVDDSKGLFFKGKYVYSEPFMDDLSFVPDNKVSFEYVKAIKEAAESHG